MKTPIAQGAEAKIYLDKKKSKVEKWRIHKLYRHPTLDQKIRTSRTKREARLLAKAKSVGVNVPKITDQSQYILDIDFIEGDHLSETLNTYPEKKQFQLMQNLGKQVSSLHENNIIHGDLTTSNTILRTNNKKQNKSAEEKGGNTKKSNAKKSTKGDFGAGDLYIIDFGLGFISTRLEDKAVDLHLIKQALEAKHFQNHEKLFNNFLKGYSWEKEKVLEQLKKVESRGRYKH